MAGRREVDKSDVDWNIAFFEIPHGTDSSSRSHISTLLSRTPPSPPSHFSIFLAFSSIFLFFSSLFFAAFPPPLPQLVSLAFSLWFRHTSLSLAPVFPYSLPWFLYLSCSLTFYFFLSLFSFLLLSLCLCPFIWPTKNAYDRTRKEKINPRGVKSNDRYEARWISFSRLLQ